MQKEFTIDQMIALKGADYYYDLHNDYDLVELKHENLCVELSFSKTKGEWFKESNPNKFKLVFNDVLYFETSKDFSNNFPKNILDIAYKSFDDFNYDFFIPEEKSDENSHIVFILEDNEYIRIFSDEIKLITLID